MLRTVGLQHSRRQAASALPQLIRLYSIPAPAPAPVPNTDKDAPPPPLSKKPKIDLRPAPIKPKSSSPLPAKLPRSFIPPTPSPTNPTKLSTAKEEVQHDLHDAQAHGILTPPPPDANWFRRTLHQGIQLFKFYYRGVKLVFFRRKEIAIIKARVRGGGAPLTRSEFRLIETQKDDINKIIPFLLIALVLEEIIPLIAIYAPFLLPSTCILPSQRERIETKRAEKAKTFSSQYYTVYAALKRAENPAGFLPLSALRNTSSAPTAVCGLLGLSTIGIDALRIRRIRRHLQFITRDDQLLFQDKLTASLSLRELREALEERGIGARGLSTTDLQSRLQWWLDAVKESSTNIDDNAIARRLALVIHIS
ncbi:LETM1 domain-containing protein mdm28, mitochondrial [Psilocybe cubensis]|uniref:Letm1 RBD domain-containing protein n=2 Tax=Psilocybe cubensis TaxID=181762 RepID=A0A8H8CPB8_PSICU|nr:LETM1 domain-containing protein mdm28, mitochondrial [Psilocybe cubensis]KAH9485296.1 LETM1 domain-containing protein mdm28, mitochondrial [Psilocybe cubensis]